MYLISKFLAVCYYIIWYVLKKLARFWTEQQQLKCTIPTVSSQYSSAVKLNMYKTADEQKLKCRHRSMFSDYQSSEVICLAWWMLALVMFSRDCGEVMTAAMTDEAHEAGDRLGDIPCTMLTQDHWGMCRAEETGVTCHHHSLSGYCMINMRV